MFKPYSDTDDSKNQSTTQAVESPPSPPLPIIAPDAPSVSRNLWDPTAFILNAKHVPFVTGESRRLRGYGGSFLWLFGLLAIVPALIFLVPTLMDASALVERGRQTTATVTNVYYTTSSGKNGTTYTYYVTFKYLDSSERSTSFTQKISKESYNRLRVGQTVAVRYVWDNAAVAQLTGKDQDDTAYNSAIGSGLLFAGGGTMMIVFGFVITTRTLRLQRSGQILKGAVLKADSSFGSKSGYSVTIQYQVISPTGKTLVRKGTATRNDLKGKPLPTQGTPVYVAYVNDSLYRLL